MTTGRRKLAELYGDWMDRHGYTQSVVAAMGGPSTSTQTKVRLTDDPISRQTLRQLDAVMGWPAGTCAGIVQGQEPPMEPDAPVSDDPATVVGTGGTGSSLMVLRPDGLSDEEWATIIEDSRGYIEWLVERTSRKRRR